MSRNFLSTIAVLASFAAGAPAFADTLSTTGSLNIANGSVQFYPLSGPAGTFNIGPPDTGIFSSLVGSTGSIQDLATLPVDTTLDITDFMTFAGAPNLSFTLTEILPGTFGACSGFPSAAGQTCTPPGTPFNLLNQTAMSSIGSATIDGYVVDTSNPGVLTPFVGVFSTQFVNASYQDVIYDLTTGGSISATYSASFITSPVTPTPEPAAVYSLFLGGLMLIGIGGFKTRVFARVRK